MSPLQHPPPILHTELLPWALIHIPKLRD